MLILTSILIGCFLIAILICHHCIGHLHGFVNLIERNSGYSNSQTGGFIFKMLVSVGKILMTIRDEIAGYLKAQ